MSNIRKLFSIDCRRSDCITLGIGHTLKAFDTKDQSTKTNNQLQIGCTSRNDDLSKNKPLVSFRLQGINVATSSALWHNYLKSSLLAMIKQNGL